MWVKLSQYGTSLSVRFKFHNYCSIDFRAEAGGQYRLLSENAQEAGQPGDTLVTLGARILDENDATVGSLKDCSFKQPYFD